MTDIATPTAEEVAALKNPQPASSVEKVEETPQPQPQPQPQLQVQTNSILDRVQSVKESSPYLKALIYGEPGVGKTVFAAGAPNPLFIDVENGTLSLLNHEELVNTVKFAPKNFSEVEQIFWELKKGNLSEFETIVIDSISELQRRHMDDHLRRKHERDRNQNAYLPFQGDYKENTEVLRRLMVQFQDLDRNLVILAHVVETKDEQTGIVSLRPSVTPKLASTLEDIMDFIGYMDLTTKEVDGKQVTERVLQTVKTRRVLAKSRIGGLDPVMVNPNFDQLMKAKMSQKQEG